MKNFNIIAAYLKKTRGIGYKNTLPWPKLSADMKHFRNLTQTTTFNNSVNSVIMGRSTFESMGNKCLKNRLNIVLTRSKIVNMSNNIDTPIFVNSLVEALNITNMYDRLIDQRFVIGGEDLYTQALTSKYCNKLFLTEIDLVQNIDCDRFFPQIPESFKIVSETANGDLIFREYINGSQSDSS